MQKKSEDLSLNKQKEFKKQLKKSRNRLPTLEEEVSQIDFLKNGKEEYEEYAEEQLAKHRVNLIKNKVLYLYKKNRELCQRCKYLEEQLEKMEYDTYNKESKKLLEVSLEINSISPESYTLLSEKLNFPSKSKIDRLCNELTKNIPDLLRNIEKVPDIVNLWREKCNISKSQTIYACLSVDAIYFTPNVILDEKSIFDGLIFKQDEEILISKNVFKLFLEKPNEFKNFLSLNSNNIIKAAFVFQVQPYDDQFPTFIVYVKAACNGKANDEIIECLNMIKDYLKNRNITVLNFVFDGDNGYKNLHENFFLSYIKSIIKNNIISFSRTRLFKISSDFLHIIKRLRYRLFWADIFAGFTLSENFFNIDKLKKLFPRLADVIWSDEPITKMHETLALVLFSPQNLLFLLEHKHFTEAAYWMPISLCILAFDGNKVGYDNRSFLLEISFWMLVFYYEQKNKSQKIELNETKRNGKKLQFYSQQLLIEFLNTIYTNIQLMHQLKKFKFSRASTDPLEHKFGCCRKRSKYVHTLNKFLRVVSHMQAIQQKEIFYKCDKFEQELEKIHCRNHSFGVVVEEKKIDADEESRSEKCYSAQQIARAMLNCAGFPEIKQLVSSDKDIIGYLINFIYDLLDEEEPPKKKRQITHRSFTYGVGQCSNGKLITTSSIKTFQIKASKKEQKKIFLEEKIREKFGLSEDQIITKKNYLELIKRIKNYSQNKMHVPTNKCSKEELVNWLLDHLRTFISIIPDI